MFVFVLLQIVDEIAVITNLNGKESLAPTFIDNKKENEVITKLKHSLFFKYAILIRK